MDNGHRYKFYLGVTTSMEFKIKYKFNMFAFYNIRAKYQVNVPRSYNFGIINVIFNIIRNADGNGIAVDDFI